MKFFDSRFVVVKIFGFACVLVVLLEVLLWKTLSQAVAVFLYPGLMLALAITGPHGGRTQGLDALAVVCGTILNILAYAVVLWGVFTAVRRFRGRDPFPPG